jgi:hypothetical protein
MKPMHDRRTRIDRRGQRGSAMTELMLLLFPYAMILLGTFVVSWLALGLQEAQKTAILAGPLQGAQTEEEILEQHFAGMTDQRHSISFSEEVDPELNQNYKDEEPVLPYEDRDDVHAGFVRIENPRVIADMDIVDGEVVITERVVRTPEGAYLRTFGIMSEDRDSDEGREADINDLLGDWLSYSRARAEYSYTHGGVVGQQEATVVGEDPDRDLRGEFAIGRTDEDGVFQPGVEYYAVSRTGQDHGSHQPMIDDVPLDELTTLELVEGQSLDPDALPEPRLDSFGVDDSAALFDIKTRLPDGP